MLNKKWVAGWGTADTVIAQNQADYIRDQSFRWVIYSGMKATSLRFRFSNRFGEENATLTKASVALSLGGHKIDTSTSIPITFNGERTLLMEAGKEYVSDEIPFSTAPGSEFAVSLYFADFTQLKSGQSNNGFFIKKFFSKGDLTECEEFSLLTLGENGPYVFLNTIDFLTDADDDCRAIVAFGDSITALPWPDYLARRINSLGINNRSVIRRGIGGNRVLRDYRWRACQHFGEAGIKRFEHDIISTTGVDSVIVLHGVNDLGHPAPNNPFRSMSDLPTAEELVNGFKQYIEIAHSHGIKIYISPITQYPRLATAIGDRETIRERVNSWIRNDAKADGIVDFESALADPADFKKLLNIYDSGDHLHPSLRGSEEMANSVPIEYIR